MAAGIPLSITLTFLIASPLVSEVAAILIGDQFGWDVAGFGVYTVLAILLGRRMGLATTTPGIKKLEGVDPWEK